MKLYAKVTDSRGKTDGRGDNTYLEVLLNERSENKFLVAFDGKQVVVLNYGTGERTVIEYAQGIKQKGEVKNCGTHAKGTCPNDCMYRNY